MWQLSSHNLESKGETAKYQNRIQININIKYVYCDCILWQVQ